MYTYLEIKQDIIDKEKALDGGFVIRTDVPQERINANQAILGYWSLYVSLRAKCGYLFFTTENREFVIARSFLATEEHRYTPRKLTLKRICHLDVIARL